jgi:hypothetical protein
VCDGAATGSFSDSNPTHQANIDCIAAYDVVNGFADGTFGGSRNITRGQMATIIANFAATTLNVNLSTIEIAAHTFTDVAGNVHADNIARIFGLNITSGRTATTFAPNDTITRAEAATMIANAHVALGVDLSGVTPSTAFTDLGSSVHASNINILAGAGVVSGKTATTFAPSASILRAETATLLVRSITVLRSQNIWAAPPLVASAAVTVISAAAGDDFDYADPVTKAAKTATTKATDTFTIDGVLSSKAAFLAAVSIGDQVVIGTNSYALTNVTRDNILSGVVGAIDDVAAPTTFNIIDPITGTALRATAITIAGTQTNYVLDGANVTAAAFTSALNNGDTVVISGNATGVDGTLAAPRTISLTNRTLTGTVSVGVPDATGIPAAGLSIKTSAGAVLAVGVVAIATDTVTVDGVAATATTILTVGANDNVTFSRTAGKNTVAFTNVAASPVTGVVAGTIPAAGGKLEFYVGTAATLTQTVENVEDYVLTVDGVAVTDAEFVAALTPGDQVVVQEADGKIVTTGSLALTNRALTGFVSAVTVLPSTVTVSAVLNANFSYAQQLTVAAIDTADPDVLFAGNLTIARTVNGAAATEAVYNAELLQIAQGYKTGVITMSDSGTVTNISLVTTATGAATLINAVLNSATQITLTFDNAVHVTAVNALTYTGGTGAIVSVAPSTSATASTTVVVTGTNFAATDTIEIGTRTSIRSAGDVPAAANGAVFTLS